MQQRHFAGRIEAAAQQVNGLKNTLEYHLSSVTKGTAAIGASVDRAQSQKSDETADDVSRLFLDAQKLSTFKVELESNLTLTVYKLYIRSLDWLWAYRLLYSVAGALSSAKEQTLCDRSLPSETRVFFLEKIAEQLWEKTQEVRTPVEIMSKFLVFLRRQEELSRLRLDQWERVKTWKLLDEYYDWYFECQGQKEWEDLVSDFEQYASNAPAELQDWERIMNRWSEMVSALVRRADELGA